MGREWRQPQYPINRGNRRGQIPIDRKRQYRNLLDTGEEGITTDLFVNVKGRRFGTWIEVDGRTNGHLDEGLIELPPYIIESIWRDELGLGSSEIDFAAVDVLGNTTNGLRKDWKFARSLNTVERSDSIVSRLAYESFLRVVKTADGKRKLVALDTNSATPYVIEQDQMNRKPLLGHSHQSFIRNQFNVGYAYNYATGAFEKSIVVDEAKSTLTSNTFTPSSFTPDEASGVVKYGNGSSDSLCGVSQSRYGIKNRMEENLLWVYDDATANLFVKKMVEWRYAPHLILDIAGWWGDTASSTRKPLISYEHGDQCYVDHPLLDSAISNTIVFIVTNKIIYKQERLVRLVLTSMR
jgi:hypothetical protein